MPFFYLLSGFVMAIAYGSELLAMPGDDTSGNDGKVFDRNRFCKIVILSRFVTLQHLANPASMTIADRNRWARLAPVCTHATRLSCLPAFLDLRKS